MFHESDEAVTAPMQLSYLWLQEFYLEGHFPVGWDDAARLSALQILVEIGYLVDPVSSTDWTSLLDRFLPSEIFLFTPTKPKTEWEMDVLSCYLSMENLTKDDARQQFERFLTTLPYGNSVFFSVRKINDPIGLPGKIDLGINMRGVHFFRPVLNEYLNSAKMKDFVEFNSSDTDVSFTLKVAGVSHEFKFETKQGREICVALETRMTDLLLDLNSKESLEDSVKKANQPKQEALMQELECLKEELEKMKSSCEEKDSALQTWNKIQDELDARTSELQKSEESRRKLVDEIETLHKNAKLERRVLQEKDSALQVALVEKNNLELRLAKLSSQGSRSNIKKANNPKSNKIQDELNARTSELQKSEESRRKLLHEIENLQKLISDKDAELRTLKERIEDAVRRNEELASILKTQSDQIAKMEQLFREEQMLRERCLNMIEAIPQGFGPS